MAHLIASVPDGFSVLSGDDALTLPLLAIGGRGVISTTSNLAPADVVELVRAFRAGDVERARALHYRLLPLFDALFCETNPIPMKAALALRGLILEELRLPLTRLSAPNRERLQAVMKEFGLL
jgi:4-hydroxy-tetrahydrodipicolinate synthase